MCMAPCSWRVRTNWILESSNASNKRHGGATREPKDVFHTLTLQALDDFLATGRKFLLRVFLNIHLVTSSRSILILHSSSEEE